MQPYCFPYIGYFQLINAVDKFVFLDDVNFINRGWINRNKILLNGEAYLFTIPLISASQNKLINEISVAENNWRTKILKTIELAYKKAPHFNTAYELIKDVFLSSIEDISTLAKKSVCTICNYLDIHTAMLNSSVAFTSNSLRGEERIINITKELSATDYLNLIGGKELYNKTNFLETGINVHFLKVKDITYKQYKNSFVPNLSIIDVMMFNDKETIKGYLKEYELIN